MSDILFEKGLYKVFLEEDGSLTLTWIGEVIGEFPSCDNLDRVKKLIEAMDVSVQDIMRRLASGFSPEALMLSSWGDFWSYPNFDNKSIYITDDYICWCNHLLRSKEFKNRRGVTLRLERKTGVFQKVVEKIDPYSKNCKTTGKFVVLNEENENDSFSWHDKEVFVVGTNKKVPERDIEICSY